MEIKCICINARYKPDNFPEEFWLEEGHTYHIVAVKLLVQEGAGMGVVLREIDLKKADTPYNCFQIGRFGFEEHDLPALERLIGTTKELSGYDAQELIAGQVMTRPVKDEHMNEDYFDEYDEGQDKSEGLGDL